MSRAGRTHSSLNSIEVGMHLNVHGTSAGTVGEGLVILEWEKGYRCCKIFRVIIETLDSSLGKMGAMREF